MRQVDQSAVETPSTGTADPTTEAVTAEGVEEFGTPLEFASPPTWADATRRSRQLGASSPQPQHIQPELPLEDGLANNLPADEAPTHIVDGMAQAKKIFTPIPVVEPTSSVARVTEVLPLSELPELPLPPIPPAGLDIPLPPTPPVLSSLPRLAAPAEPLAEPLAEVASEAAAPTELPEPPTEEELRKLIDAHTLAEPELAPAEPGTVESSLPPLPPMPPPPETLPPAPAAPSADVGTVWDLPRPTAIAPETSPGVDTHTETISWFDIPPADAPIPTVMAPSETFATEGAPIEPGYEAGLEAELDPLTEPSGSPFLAEPSGLEP